MAAADIPTKAANVCLTCKIRKKRCDKSLPSCRYCADHDIPCRYQTPTPIRVRPHAGPVLASSAIGSFGTSASTRSPLNSLASVPQLPNNVLTLTCTSESALYNQAQRVLETTGLYLDEISVRYFQGIHTFVPLVSRRLFHAQLLTIGAKRQTDFALLVLCMGLLTYSAESPDSPPAVQRGHRVANQTLYVATKSLLAQAQAVCAPSLRLIQAGVLLAVYEYASGCPEKAFVTIGSCARMAYAARLRSSPSLTSTAPLRSDWNAEEEEVNTWWGIRICERTFLCELPVIEQPLGSMMPTREDRLPLESSVLDLGSTTTALAPHVMVHALSALQVGGFGRAAQAAWLLDNVLEGLLLTNPERKHAHLTDCDRSLQSFLAIVMQQMQQQADNNYGVFCVAIALTIRTLFLLHWHLLEQRAEDSPPGLYNPANSSHSALDTVTKMVIDICATHENLSFHQIGQLPPSCLYIIRAALKHINDCQSARPDPRLYTSLKQFEARWGASPGGATRSPVVQE
ncbi:hypothetical protein ASPACDRAFT_111479 [Aspergillus aculeatus ATCC 16872]|uniref:Zn(2)-C6 fungal-type domain-containing protein n=1 Tax=Aspergillus aculeatus (strain ATCC 16872 / CBS 172.66 / WB 5094) TaxID=690307 RepID=A0A1L9X5A6_ASPA1|nr:uncharacterized protein ASPACDRAFT_111479 [Aspergillus aculeatus ATCC 16872]OJK03622.1 hypothetical protein ASPACDRAFT_111479 [Aspergillus aculeatus ATCC 16872]